MTCGQALPCRLVGLESGTTVPVPAGTRREFRVAVRTQSGISHSTRHPVRVLARLHGAETDAQAQPSTAISVVEMIPLSLGTGSLMHTIPMTFVTTAGMAFAPGFTGLLEESINASGTLDESGGHRLDLGIRKQLATGQDPLFAASDRYSIRYEQRLGEALFGDHAYSLSPLLVMNQYARGVGGTLALDPLRFSTILYRDVWSTEGSQGLGGASTSRSRRRDPGTTSSTGWGSARCGRSPITPSSVYGSNITPSRSSTSSSMPRWTSVRAGF